MKANEVTINHVPVLLDQVLEFLMPKNGESFLDCTFGAGGYSKAILKAAHCRVNAIDCDPNVLEFAKDLSNTYGNSFEFKQANFVNSHSIFQSKKFDGIVMDLGVSSMQLDHAERGFSFLRDGPLDMRMGCFGYSAVDFINNAPESEISRVIRDYGEEQSHKRIARKIIRERAVNQITTTAQLACIVRSCIFRSSKIDLATKTFQAIRIYVNDEIRALERFLSTVSELLNIGGRIVIVSFHSLEDTLVKSFFKQNAPVKRAHSKYAKPLKEPDDKMFRILTPKPVIPSSAEIKANIRSRSAKLRAAIKMANIKNV